MRWPRPAVGPATSGSGWRRHCSACRPARARLVASAGSSCSTGGGASVGAVSIGADRGPSRPAWPSSRLLRRWPTQLVDADQRRVVADDRPGGIEIDRRRCHSGLLDEGLLDEGHAGCTVHALHRQLGGGDVLRPGSAGAGSTVGAGDGGERRGHRPSVIPGADRVGTAGGRRSGPGPVRLSRPPGAGTPRRGPRPPACRPGPRATAGPARCPWRRPSAWGWPASRSRRA